MSAQQEIEVVDESDAAGMRAMMQSLSANGGKVAASGGGGGGDGEALRRQVMSNLTNLQESLERQIGGRGSSSAKHGGGGGGGGGGATAAPSAPLTLQELLGELLVMIFPVLGSIPYQQLFVYGRLLFSIHQFLSCYREYRKHRRFKDFMRSTYYLVSVLNQLFALNNAKINGIAYEFYELITGVAHPAKKNSGRSERLARL